MTFVNQVLIECGSERATLADLIFHHLPRFLGGEADTHEQHIVQCPSGTRVIGPNDGEIRLKPLARVYIRVCMTKAKVVTGPVILILICLCRT